MLSDYSLYLYKSGQYDKCLGEFQTSIYPPNQPEDTKIADAIIHNFQLCLKARKDVLGEPVPTTKCSLKSKLIPTAGAIEFPGKESCVGFAEVRDDCRQLAFFERDAKTGKIKKTNLKDPIDDSILNDSATGCWIEKIQLIKKNAQMYLYFNGGGRACGGGTMDAEITSVYSIDGTTLKLKESVNVNYH